jgi:hypothetical protein
MLGFVSFIPLLDGPLALQHGGDQLGYPKDKGSKHAPIR